MRITLSATVKQYINVEPNTRVNLAGFEGDKIKEKVTITSLEEQLFKITDITSDIEDKIKYKLKTIEKGKKYSLEISNRSSQEGKFRGKIELKTNSEKKPLVVIYVHSKLAEEVSMKPRSVSFGTIDTSEENFDKMSFIKRIVLRDVRGNGLTIKKIKTSSDWITTETRTRKEGKILAIIVTLDKDKLPKGRFEEKIKIRTNYKKEYLEVDVKGEVI